jgi:hypothetical protein
MHRNNHNQDSESSAQVLAMILKKAWKYLEFSSQKTDTDSRMDLENKIFFPSDDNV